MSTVFKLPKSALGILVPEHRLKSGLQKLNPDINFDRGSRQNLPHPEMDYCQGVYYKQDYVTVMDRGNMLDGMIPEVPVWTTAPDVVRVHHSEVSAAEIMRQPEMFPAPCFEDPDLWQVVRPVRDQLLLVGWRHVIDCLIAKRVPGVSRYTVEQEFSDYCIDLSAVVEPIEKQVTDKMPWEENEWLDDAPEEGQVLEEMGVFEKRPTVVLGGK